MRYITSILFLFISSIAFGQVGDSLKADYIPTGIRIGVDLIKLGQTIINDDIKSTLVVADIDIHRYLLALEYGMYDRTRNGPNDEYHTEGNFWRVGVDVNLFHKHKDHSVMFMGLRFANSTFSDKLKSTTGNIYYGEFEENYSNSNVKAEWYELVGGLKVPIWKFWLGYQARLKFRMQAEGWTEFVPYEVPGYGLAAEKDYWEFNYYIMYRIGWGEK